MIRLLQVDGDASLTWDAEDRLVSAAGRVLCSAPPSSSDFNGWAVLASKLLGFQRTTLRNTAPGQCVEEIVLTTDDLCHVVRPVPPGVGMEAGHDGGWFVLLTFDPRTSSLVRRKLELDRFGGEVGAATFRVNGG